MSPALEPQDSPLSVLIADDEPLSRRSLEALLKRWGYDVVVATGGRDAWRILQREDSPRLAIVDWLMPDMDGLELCSRLRGHSDYTYVILLTCKDRREDFLEGMRAGADDYITKPFYPIELEVRLRAGRRVLELKQALLRSIEDIRQAEHALAEARERELQFGARIQKTLLVGYPPADLRFARIATLTLPSQQVDGDFTDFYKNPSGGLDLVVGDVMGKGPPAALIGAAIKTQLIRAVSQLRDEAGGDWPPAPATIVNRVHQDVIHELTGLEAFVTLCYARFDPGAHRMTLVDCGHTETLMRRGKTGEVVRLKGDHVPLGFSPEEQYAPIDVEAESGDAFFFYSDGLTEATDPDGHMVGLDRVEEWFREHGGGDPEAMIEHVRETLATLRGDHPVGDDVTCVVVKML